MSALPPWRACLLLACGIAAAAPIPARAAPDRAATMPVASASCAPHAAEAAVRSALSEAVILRVMHVESRGRVHAISPKGAMGCMQIMPATWRYLTARYGLGGDPWNARFNMIGGALYLAEMARQFGFPGAYAAYNAGPARYARHVRGGAALPAETVAYMASLSGRASPRRGDGRADEGRGAGATPRWQNAGLFLTVERPRASASEPATETAPRADTMRNPALHAADDGEAPAPPPRANLFPLARETRKSVNDNLAGEK